MFKRHILLEFKGKTKDKKITRGQQYYLKVLRLLIGTIIVNFLCLFLIAVLFLLLYVVLF